MVKNVEETIAGDGGVERTDRYKAKPSPNTRVRVVLVGFRGDEALGRLTRVSRASTAGCPGNRATAAMRTARARHGIRIRPARLREFYGWRV